MPSLAEVRTTCSKCGGKDSYANMLLVFNKAGDELRFCRDCVYEHWNKILEKPKSIYVGTGGWVGKTLTVPPLSVCCGIGPECPSERLNKTLREEKSDSDAGTQEENR